MENAFIKSELARYTLKQFIKKKRVAEKHYKHYIALLFAETPTQVVNKLYLLFA